MIFWGCPRALVLDTEQKGLLFPHRSVGLGNETKEISLVLEGLMNLQIHILRWAVWFVTIVNSISTAFSDHLLANKPFSAQSSCCFCSRITSRCCARLFGLCHGCAEMLRHTYNPTECVWLPSPMENYCWLGDILSLYHTVLWPVNGSFLLTGWFLLSSLCVCSKYMPRLFLLILVKRSDFFGCFHIEEKFCSQMILFDLTLLT